ncbi:MAG: gamma-glutamyl-gamma-aminobutyrate hydrolase family protein [Nitrospinae bacterium]|nr:gamma-glutamyl-gamma-aminobutyrate hydrolase family protein [Nitrospinota bacterium]
MPLIGITADMETITNSRGATEPRYFLKRAVADAVAMAGGNAIIIPFVRSAREARAVMKRLGGLIISGGNFDIPPSLYGERKIKACGALNPERSKSELLLLAEALKSGKPALGICGGHQLINVHFGGTLYQDVPSQTKGALTHSQKQPHHFASHSAEVAVGTALHAITGNRTLNVNSTHHQAVKKLGTGLVASALAPDGTIEGIEKPGKRFIIGVQWHPEFLVKGAPHLALFKALVKAAGN